MKSSASEIDPFDTNLMNDATKCTTHTMAFTERALPLHINLTHTPPKMPDEDEIVVPDDPGHIGTMTLVPSACVGGGHGWKGTRTVQVELLNVEKGEERELVDVILSVNAVVVKSKNETQQVGPIGRAINEADGGKGGYESDNDTNANDSSI